jgi:hypothetical protein
MTTAEVSNDLPPEAADIDAVVEGDAMLAVTFFSPSKSLLITMIRWKSWNNL